MLEQYSVECYLSEPIDAACSARAEALVIWRALGDRLREGDALRWLSRLWWIRGVRADAERFASEALSVLEALPPGRELAMAYSNRSQLAMLVADVDGSVDWGTRAIAIAEPLGDTACLVNTLISVGTAEHTADRPGGVEKLERSLALALEHDHPECVVRAYSNITSNFCKKCEYDRAEVYLRDGLSYCEERDMVSWSLYLLGVARTSSSSEETGREPRRTRTPCSRRRTPPRSAAFTRSSYWRAFARIAVMPVGRQLLDEARDLASSTREPQRIWPVACARAEAAWLLGDVDRTAHEAAIDWSMTNDGHVQSEDRSRHTRHAMWDRRGIRWEVGQLALWLWRANRLPEIRTSFSLAVERQIAGDWRGAADEWKRLGSPLQQAMALADADDERALREALELLAQLGSVAGCAHVRRRMRALGIRGIPRGERASTRRNPARLTARQLEILAFVCEGRRDAEIAAQCFLSTKTVGHHVSAILGKLGVRSRGEANAAARAMGIFTS